ncbi:hypothetical protein [Ferrovibrio sp.]|uniref:hypothetical protein n=1 Tax=Ferrovibrio sp. TaxID=1917215 RepID=UPI003D0DF28B
MARIRISGGDIDTKLWTLLDWQASGKSLFARCEPCERTVLVDPAPLVARYGAYNFVQLFGRFRCQVCHRPPDFSLRRFGKPRDPRQADMLAGQGRPD